MAEYIERKNLVKKIRRVIAELPAADAVGIVHCRECKWYHDFEDFCDCGYARGLTDVGPNDYCSYGEKIEKTEE